jgi:hypothetical protein
VVRRYRYVRQVLVSNLYAGASPARISQIGRVISRIGRMILWPCRKSCSKGRDGTYLPVVLACRVAQAVNVLRGAYLLLLPSSSQGRASGADARCMYHVSCPETQPAGHRCGCGSYGRCWAHDGILKLSTCDVSGRGACSAGIYDACRAYLLG